MILQLQWGYGGLLYIFHSESRLFGCDEGDLAQNYVNFSDSVFLASSFWKMIFLVPKSVCENPLGLELTWAVRFV